MKRVVTKIPNRITLGRLLACPLFVLFFWLGVRPVVGEGAPDVQSSAWMWAAFGVLIGQEVSDFLDGELARRSNAVTDLGKLMDPLADTLSHMGALLCLLWAGLVPLWLVVLLYYREAIVGTLRILVARYGLVMGARYSGKVKATLQGLLCILLVLGLALEPTWPEMPLRAVAFWLSLIVAAVTVWSLVDYWVSIRRVMGDRSSMLDEL